LNLPLFVSAAAWQAGHDDGFSGAVSKDCLKLDGNCLVPIVGISTLPPCIRPFISGFGAAEALLQLQY
jgi:hypothetical protein